jgi:agmatine/peptidylarginine deiminase
MKTAAGTAHLLASLCLLGCAANNGGATDVTPRSPAAHERLRPFNEYTDSGVVMLAMTPDDEDVFAVQMNIASKAAKGGPVFLLESDADTRRAVYAKCSKYELCNALASWRVRLVEAPFEGPWIRDYGPQFVHTAQGTPVIVDSRYRDVRNEQQVAHKRQYYDQRRARLAESALLRARWGNLLPASVSASSTDRELALLQHLSEALGNPYYNQRTIDDEAPFFIAEATMRAPAFAVTRPAIDLDGGNIMRLPDGRCATTGELIGRNIGESADLEALLRDSYGCKSTVFLRALPGHDVIEHVDMFLLPARQKVLLASYDPTDPSVPTLSDYFSKVDEGLRTLILEAAVIMKENYRRLRAAGYEVELVRSPLPRFDEDDLYYPTVLNALVRVGQSGRTQVIAPSYHDYQVDIQEQAFKKMREAFGDVDFDTVESTVAAKRQGAVHCLTLGMPYQDSSFADTGQSRDEQAMQKLASKIQLADAVHAVSGAWVLSGVEGGSRVALSIDEGRITATIGSRSQTWQGKFTLVDPTRLRMEVGGDEGPSQIVLEHVSGSDELIFHMSSPKQDGETTGHFERADAGSGGR